MVPVVFVTWLMIVLVVALVSYVTVKVAKTHRASLCCLSSRKQCQKYQEV